MRWSPVIALAWLAACGDAPSHAGPAPAARTVTASPILPACPRVSPPRAVGAVQSRDIDEASGVVASRRQPGVLWLHDDSGEGPRVFAMSEAGVDLGAYELLGASALDWEDLAIGPDPEGRGDALYLGDIGDNAGRRASVTVYRVAEPIVAAPPQARTELADVVAIELVYPDGPHDAETLLVDPRTGDLFVVAKFGNDGNGVYRAPAPHRASPIALERVAVLPLGPRLGLDDTLATGGDISADGRWVAIRTYRGGLAWPRVEGESIADAFRHPACTLTIDEGGESLGWLPDGRGYVMVPEGAGATIWRGTWAD